ncbi:hypothetical protein [Alteribacillus sp. HJP-4]|uniref:hypothetical protein n=1 Tax=Alteribacillus sp. HJP-4 TaxID=2775394 RepID=UPI0035CCFBB8
MYLLIWKIFGITAILFVLLITVVIYRIFQKNLMLELLKNKQERDNSEVIAEETIHHIFM